MAASSVSPGPSAVPSALPRAYAEEDEASGPRLAMRLEPETVGASGADPEVGGWPEDGTPFAPRLLELLDRAYRTFATGFCFAVFGLGQLLLAVTVFPLVVLLVRDLERRKRVGRAIVHWAFRAFVRLMQVTRCLDYRIQGSAELRKPGTLVLANHPSLIDVVFLISFIPEADCVVKSSLLRNPFTRFAILAAGYIPNHDDPERIIQACEQSLAAGGILIVFPEGTRTEPGQALKFQRGAAQIAVRTRSDMIPVVIRTGEHNLGRHSKWWRVPSRRVRFDFEVKEQLSIQRWVAHGREPAQAARELTEFLTASFRREMANRWPSWLRN